MLAIVNVSPEGTPLDGLNEYEVRINREVIGRFTHKRSVLGAARCLRDAADAVDKWRYDQHAKFWLAILEHDAQRRTG